jgi:2',3'-cyclic-nucleotide 2'-phosphodiesterase (5'-nucleotidase family)
MQIGTRVLLSLPFLFFSNSTVASPGRESSSVEAHIQGQIAEPKSPSWPACGNGAELQTLTFLHVSDVHAQYNPDSSGSSPLARLRGFYERTKQENPFTLLTNAGDDYEKGSIAEVLSRGRTTRQVVQAMGYDVRTMGNHDFAWGLEEALAFSRDPRAIVLASNVEMIGDQPDAQKPGWIDYAVLTVGCVRIGFFGPVSRPWNENGEQYDGSYYPELRTDFHYVEIAREIISRHRQDLDLLVLVSHLGVYEDTRIAEQTEGIDLILGGHSHTLHADPVKVKETAIMHVGANAEHIGRMDITYDLRGRRVLGHDFELVSNVGDLVTPDPAVSSAIAEILAPYSEELTKEVAWVRTPQSRDSMAHIAARAAVETLGVDAALVGTQTVWTTWRSGGLTQQDALNAFRVTREPVGQPGTSSLYRVDVTGDVLLQARRSLAHFAYWGPLHPDRDAFYTLAIQKPQAFNQVKYFGREIGDQSPEPAAELWELVVAFGRARTRAGLVLDVNPSGGGETQVLTLLKRPSGLGQ